MWPKSQRVLSEASYWTKWVQTWHGWTWGVNLPFFEGPTLIEGHLGWLWSLWTGKTSPKKGKNGRFLVFLRLENSSKDLKMVQKWLEFNPLQSQGTKNSFLQPILTLRDRKKAKSGDFRAKYLLWNAQKRQKLVIFWPGNGPKLFQGT